MHRISSMDDVTKEINEKVIFHLEKCRKKMSLMESVGGKRSELKKMQLEFARPEYLISHLLNC